MNFVGFKVLCLSERVIFSGPSHILEELCSTQMDLLQNDPSHIDGSEDEFWPLSGKPYFNMVLKKSHVKPMYTLSVPAKVTKLLPSVDVPVVFSYHGKQWETCYTIIPRECRSQCLRTSIKWRKFVIDNHLKQGDACVFEISECSNTLVKIRVQILRGDFPSQLMNGVSGPTPNNPITI